MFQCLGYTLDICGFYHPSIVNNLAKFYDHSLPGFPVIDPNMWPTIKNIVNSVQIFMQKVYKTS